MGSYTNSDYSYQTLRGSNMSGVIKENPCYVVLKKRGLSEGIRAKTGIIIMWHSIV